LNSCSSPNRRFANSKEKFNALGFVFGKSAPNALTGSRAHNIYAEVDVFLENGVSALAVEMKAQVNVRDIQEHANWMEKCALAL
jgi:hypothetical protein